MSCAPTVCGVENTPIWWKSFEYLAMEVNDGKLSTLPSLLLKILWVRLKMELSRLVDRFASMGFFDWYTKESDIRWMTGSGSPWANLCGSID